jgi:hypothetical protein
MNWVVECASAALGFVLGLMVAFVIAYPFIT